MSEERNIKKPRHKLIYKAKDYRDFQRALNEATDMFGHQGKDNGWWWSVQGRFRDKVIVFKFDHKSDASILRMCL